jgi:hypothetical protein
MSAIYERRLPALLIFFIAIFSWINFYTGQFGDAVSSMKTGVAALWGFANVLSAIYFFIRGYNAVKRRGPYWYLTIYSMLLAVVFLVVGLAVSQSGDQYLWLSNAIIVPGDRVCWLPIVFSVLTIMQRAYVARDYTTLAFVIGGLLTIVQAVPIFGSNASFLAFTNWHNIYVRMVTRRVLAMGAGTAAIALVARQFLGIERKKVTVAA